MANRLDVPVLRFGRRYTSLDGIEVRDFRDQSPLARVSQANAGLVRRDLARCAADARAALGALSCDELVGICSKAATLFMEAELPIGEARVGPDEYTRLLSATSGLPHTLVRANMGKVAYVLANMGRIIDGLTRGLDRSVIDTGVGTQAGAAVAYQRNTALLGAVLPSNSPGVNSIWLPAVALKTPIAIKPGREEPWTPLRLIAALIEAGAPAEAFGFYPTDHEGADGIMNGCGRAIIFGDDRTVSRYAADPRIEVHGAGYSKVVIGPDMIDQPDVWLEVTVQSIAANGGRSCINASTVLVPRDSRAVAEALADRLAAIEPRALDDEQAQLAAFANPAVAAWIDQAIEQDLAIPGATDLTAARRSSPRRIEQHGCTFLQPTVVHCDGIDHPLARREFLFPYASVFEVDFDQLDEALGSTLACSVITADAALTAQLVACPTVDRLNIGPVPTSRVQWDQPHEGNLFELLYRRRALQMA